MSSNGASGGSGRDEKTPEEKHRAHVAEMDRLRAREEEEILNALRRRKELSDICDVELQLREEEAKRRQRETADRLARLEKEREEKHRCDGCSSDFKPGRGNGKKDRDQN